MTTNAVMCHQRSKRKNKGPRVSGIIAVAPVLFFMALFFFLPIALLLIYSFLSYEAGEVTYQLTLENYKLILSSTFYWGIIARTIKVAFVTTFVCILLGYPVAYQIARTRSRLRPLLLLLVVAPLLIGGVVRGYGWILILNYQGVVNSLLLHLNVVEAPIQMLYNFFGIIVAMVEVMLPFFILPMIGAINNVNPDIERAALSFGASHTQTFMRVTLPLTTPGVIAGASIVFSLASSIFVIPQIIGGASYLLLSTLAYQQIGKAGNWPLGSAVSVVMLVITFVVLTIGNIFIARRFKGSRG